MEEQQSLLRVSEDPDALQLVAEVANLLERSDHRFLDHPDPAGSFAHLLEIDRVGELIADAEPRPPLAQFALLKGLLGSIRRAYDALDGPVRMREGLLVPVAKRGVNSPLRATPDEETVGVNGLFRKSGFYLYELERSDHVEIELDFSVAERLDELTWIAEGRLPRIATVHPSLGEDGVRFPPTAKGCR